MAEDDITLGELNRNISQLRQAIERLDQRMVNSELFRVTIDGIDLRVDETNKRLSRHEDSHATMKAGVLSAMVGSVGAVVGAVIALLR